MKKWFKTLCEDVITFISPYIKNDETWIRFTYFLSHHRSVNLKAPKRFNDKLQWLLLNYHDWSYTDMVDKYRVKPIVAKLLGRIISYLHTGRGIVLTRLILILYQTSLYSNAITIRGAL